MPSYIIEELQQAKFKKKPSYSTSLIRYALMLRYTSLQSYKILLKDFKLPSVSFLRKLKQGNIDSLRCVSMLHDDGCISDDVILIFDEMILQRSEEFIGGELIGSDENGELFKGIMSFMMHNV